MNNSSKIRKDYFMHLWNLPFHTETYYNPHILELTGFVDFLSIFFITDDRSVGREYS